MKRTTIIIVLLNAASISVFGQKSDKKSYKTNGAKEQVTALVTQYAQAMVNKDTAVLERILSEDYSDIDSAGFPMGKVMVINWAKTEGAVKYETFDLIEPVARIYNKDTAVIIALATLKLSGAEARKVIITFTAVKNGRLWQIVARHESEALKGKIST
jgi:hypothetical protein